MHYVPALDGIRAVAVLLVILFHAQVPFVFGGYLGVDIFFVLSGYLITTLLLVEIGSTGTVELRRFYLKRARRLMPPLILLLTLYLAFAPLAWPDYRDHVRDAIIAALYLSDFAPLMAITPKMLSHTWSLSVEQHYYLFWPLVLAIMVRRWRGRLVPILVGLYLAATLWRVHGTISGLPWGEVYYRFDYRLSGLMIGSLLAAMLQRRPTLPAPSLMWAAPVSYAAAACVAALQWKNPLGLLAGVPFAELAAVVLILVALRPGNSLLHRLLTAPLMVYLGQISYGLYLYHYPVFRYLRDHVSWPVTLSIGLPLSLGLAMLSYHGIEAIGRRSRVAAPVAAG